MTAPALGDTLSTGYMTAAAGKARASYRALLGAILIVEAAAGIALVVAPASVAALLDLDATGAVPLARLAGILILIVAMLLATGRGFPARAKLVNLIGMVARGAVAILLVAQGHRLVWPALAEAAAALALAASYYAYFKAEVMNRP